MSQIKQCQYIIPKTGEQCKRNAESGSDYCWQHKEMVESQLVPELEDLMSEYVDYKTYQDLIKYNPNMYSLEKYESKIANAESQRQHDLVGPRFKELETYYADNSDKQYIIKEELANLAFENIESTLEIMQKLGMLEYEGEENNEITMSSDGERGNIRLGVKLSLNPKGYQDLVGSVGDITLSDDRKGLSFISQVDDEEYQLQLTPLYRLLYRNIENYINYI